MSIKQKFSIGDPAPVDPSSFLDAPLKDRLRTLVLHWTEFGAGSPRKFHLIYILKITFLWGLVGAIIIGSTSGLGWFWEIAQWWNHPIVYQKLIIWTMLIEAVGLGASWGPMGTNFKPFTGSILYWARPGTIRLPPFRWVPGTAGDTRTVIDVVLYLGFCGSLLAALLLPGVPSASLSAALPDNTSGLVNSVPVIVAVAFLLVLGLRDKVAFLGARSDQYLWALLFFVTLDFVDMIVALKMLLVLVWVGAAVGKMGPHFGQVMAPMLSNTPFTIPRAFKRALYRGHPDDVRPSWLAKGIAHYAGILIELVAPLVMLFSTNPTLTMVAVSLMVVYCLAIVSTFPLAVPLEWNLLFAFAAVFLFIGFPNTSGYGLANASGLPLVIGLAVLMLVLPVLGNVLPAKISFLWSLRQYSGNWSTTMWTFKPGAEGKLNAIKRPAPNQVDQLQQLGLPPVFAEITMQQIIAWRSMHSQGRGLLSVLFHFLPDIETRTLREGENVATTLVGWNFGDGHLHGQDLIDAVQARCEFAPGELVVVLAESSPIYRPVQQWRLVDACVGEIARGTWDVRDCIAEQPWLPNGSIPLQVTHRSPLRPPFETTNSVSQAPQQNVPKAEEAQT
jgi:hypothetical protein